MARTGSGGGGDGGHQTWRSLCAPLAGINGWSTLVVVLGVAICNVINEILLLIIQAELSKNVEPFQAQ